MRRRAFVVGSVLVAAGAAAAFSENVLGPPPIRFREVAESSGVDFVLQNSPTAEKHLLETMPGGVAIFDYNNDGRPDLYFTNGAAQPSLQKESPRYYNRLYRNDGGMKFTDVTQEAGVAGAGYSNAVAAADYDNDGYVDLFVAGVNRNILYRNLGNGKIEDVTAKAGIASGVWAAAAGWFDYDNDGKLDLLVVHYAKWPMAEEPFCGNPATGLRDYCDPRVYQGLASTLYHNRGDGTFEDVSVKSGVGRFPGRGMSVAFADYDGDGFMDAFVTNDKMPNFLFHNRGNGTFEEKALEAGVALPDHGRSISGMGADFRDYDNDGLPDIVMTAMANETFPLFHNLGRGSFEDASYSSRLGPAVLRSSGWGVGLFDFNNDGWKDLFVAQSHVTEPADKMGPIRYKQPNGVYVNLGSGKFADVSAQAGQYLSRAHRGSAYADLNGDGKIDVVVSCLGEPAEIWENVSPNPNHWIILRLVGTRSNRDGIGARVSVGSQHNQMTTAVSYASSSSAGVHFGLGPMTRIPKIEIRWPAGGLQVLANITSDQVLEVREPGGP